MEWREKFLIQYFFTSQSSKSMMWKTMQSGNLAVKRVRNHWDAYMWASKLRSEKWLCKSGNCSCNKGKK